MSAAVTAMVCAPVGVPGVVWWLGDEELHPESETRAVISLRDVARCDVAECRLEAELCEVDCRRLF